MKDGPCAEGPSEAEPATFACPDCRGEKCPDCGGSGEWRVTACPLALVDPPAWDALEAAALAGKGLWPVAGGAFDQAEAALEAIGLVWQEERPARARRGRTDACPFLHGLRSPFT